MPDILTGNANNVSNALAANVLTTTGNGVSPIVITTNAPHLFGDQDYVFSHNIGGNTNANGVHQITVLSATQFSLNGTSGNGAYTSGGSCFDQSYTPQAQFPDNGEPADTASIVAAIGALFDRTQKSACGSRDDHAFAIPSLGFTSSFKYALDSPEAAALLVAGQNEQWLKDRVGGFFPVDFQKASGTASVTLTSGGTTTAGFNLFNAGVTIAAGDLVEVEFASSVDMNFPSGTPSLTLKIEMQVKYGGGAFATVGTQEIQIDQVVATSLRFPFVAKGVDTASVGTYAVQAKLTGTAFGDATDSIHFAYPYTATAKVWRAT